MKRGDKVQLLLQAEITSVHTYEPKYAIRLEPHGAAGAVGLFVSSHEISNPEGDWRDVCADMIRVGREREAVALLVEKAPHVVPYIKALEELLATFAKLPALDAYERMVWRDVAGMFGGKLQAREKIECYSNAIEAWKRAMSIQNGEAGEIA